MASCCVVHARCSILDARSKYFNKLSIKLNGEPNEHRQKVVDKKERNMKIEVRNKRQEARPRFLL